MRLNGMASASVLSVALSVLMATPAAAKDKEQDIKVSCDASSDYNVSMNGQDFVFEGKTKRMPRVVLGAGHVTINGSEANLSVADQKRIGDFEAEMRLLVPESQKVVTEAVNIAYDALSQVSAGLSRNPKAELAKYEKSRAKALAGLSQPDILPIFNEQSMDDIVEPIVAEFLPSITSHAIAFAFRAMFAGEAKESKMEANLDNMDDELDRRVEARADALQPLAESMCKRIQRMDTIDDSLEVRLPSGKPINLLNAKKAE